MVRVTLYQFLNNMQVIKERETHSKDSWLKKLNLTELDFAFLLENAIFKIEISDNGDKKFRNRFVGFIAISNDIIFSQPKFSTSEVFDFNLLLSIFNQYKIRKNANKSIKEFNYFSLSDSDLESTLFEYNLYISLLEYYQQFGIYSTEKREYIHVRNNINWIRTVNNSMPLHSENNVIYHNPIGLNISDENNHITQLQISILLYLDSKYNINQTHIQLKDLEKYAPISKNDLISNASIWFHLIQNEIATTYQQNHLLLLRYLSSFFSENKFIFTNTKKSLYGTITFHAIWEDACSQVFNSQYEFLKEKIAQPKWKFTTPLTTKEVTGQIPDILNESNESIYILDAKYYFPLPYNLCGWGDIVKQYFYAKSFHNPINKKIKNILLFPAPDIDEIKVVGKVIMEREGKEENNFLPIYICKLNPLKIFATYINNKDNVQLLDEFNSL